MRNNIDKTDKQMDRVANVTLAGCAVISVLSAVLSVAVVILIIRLVVWLISIIP